MSGEDTGYKATYCVLVINKTHLVFNVDSDADITCLPEAEYRRLTPTSRLEPTSLSLTSPGGNVECQGQFVATTAFRQKN